MSPDCNVGTIAFGRGRFDSIGWQERGIAVSPNFASGAVAAMAPLGDALVIAVNYSRQHVTYGPPRACTQYEQLQTDSLGNPLLCADRIQADTSDHVAFHRFARNGAGFVPLTGPSASARRLASETSAQRRHILQNTRKRRVYLT